MDIVEIHNTILHSFNNETQMLPTIESQLNKLCSIDEPDDTIIQEIDSLKKKRDIIKKRENISFYLLQITPIIEEYKKELNKPVQVHFMKVSSTPVNNDKINKIKDKFIRIARKFFPIESVESFHSIPECKTCLNNSPVILLGTHINICAVCGTEVDVSQVSFAHNDNERVNITSKYQYDRRVHFKECINQFQGKQNSTIKQKVYDSIILQLVNHGLVNEDATTKEEKYANVTKQHISIFLKETGYSNHYEDINMIYHNITGKPLPDISHIEHLLMEDFDKLSNIYDEEYIRTRKITRKNFINTQYVLYQLLKRHKFPCSRNDFVFLKTVERQGFHDDICSNLFKKLGWNFQAIF